MSWHPFPADEVAEDVERLANAAAQIAVDRGHGGAEAAAYAFALASLLVNAVFQDGFPDHPTTRLRVV